MHSVLAPRPLVTGAHVGRSTVDMLHTSLSQLKNLEDLHSFSFQLINSY